MYSRLTIARSILVTLFIVGAALFLLTGERVRGTEAPSGAAARLVTFEPMSDLIADSCAWEVAAPLRASQSNPSASGTPSGPYKVVTWNDAGDPVQAPSADADKPLRFVQDPYPSFSAVEVDPVRNEVVLMDGNRFNVMFYDRTVNTPRTATHTPPKRIIGGLKTLSQFPSDVYLDPTNGDIYVPNNDSLEGMNVFSRKAQGNVAPDRHLQAAPYGSFGIVIDEERQELLMTIQHDGAVAVWKKMANDKDTPVRLIQGDRTQMADPHGIALDPKNKLIFVTNYGTSHQTKQQPTEPGGKPRVANWPAGNLGIGGIGRYRYEVLLGTGRFDLPSVTVYSKDAEGNVAPIRVIRGPKTGLSWPTGIAVDPDRGEVYVANDTGHSVTVYSADANGDVAPIRTLKGPRSLIKNPTGVFVDTANDEVWVANFGNHTATVYHRTANGDAEPLRVIRTAPLDTPATFISNPFSIVYDTRREEVLVPNCVQHPRIAAFPVMSDRAALPARTIEGQNTKLNRTVHSIGYDDVHDEIVVQSNIGQAILTFRGGASGDEAPIRVIQGAKTLLRDPEKIAVDPVHNEIFAINMTIDEEVLVFDRLAQGDVAPKRVLKGPDTKLGAANLTVDPLNNLLIVTGGEGILIFDRTAAGNTKPLRQINGNGGGAIRVYPPTGMIITNVRDRKNGPYTAVWSIADSGDAPPRWTVGKGMLKEVRGVTYDAKRKTIIVSDKLLAGLLTYSLPEVFERSATITAQR